MIRARVCLEEPLDRVHHRVDDRVQVASHSEPKLFNLKQMMVLRLGETEQAAASYRRHAVCGDEGWPDSVSVTDQLGLREVPVGQVAGARVP